MSNTDVVICPASLLAQKTIMAKLNKAKNHKQFLDMMKCAEDAANDGVHSLVAYKVKKITNRALDEMKDGLRVLGFEDVSVETTGVLIDAATSETLIAEAHISFSWRNTSDY